MPRKKKAPEPLAHILFADAERQNLQRRLLRHIVALRLKELDSLTSLENLLAYHGIPRLDLIEAIMENLAVQNADDITDAEVDAWLAKWRTK